MSWRVLRWVLVVVFLLVARHAIYVSFTDRVGFADVEQEPPVRGITTVDCSPVLHGGEDESAYAGTVLEDTRCDGPATIRRVAAVVSLFGVAALLALPRLRRRSRRRGDPLTKRSGDRG